MQRRYPCGRRAANRLLGLLLGICVLSILPVWAQGQSTKPAKSAATDKRSAATAPRKPPVPPPPPLPQTIRVGSTEMPLTDVVPNTEAALSRLQQTLDKTKDPTLLRLRQAIDAFSAKTKKSRDETVYLVQNARSAEQLSETRLVWWKDQQELDNLNSSLQSYIQVLTEEQRQVSQIQREWLLAAPPPEEGILPPGLLDRIQQVQQTAATADAAVRSTLDSLVQLQVRISDVRKLVDDIVQQTDNAERRLHASILVLDGPPIWSAMRGSSYARLREQARITVIAVRSRTLNFYSSRRYALVGYLVVLFALTAVFFRLRGYQQRQQPPGQEASLASRAACKTHSRSPLSPYCFFLGSFSPMHRPRSFVFRSSS